MSEVRHLPLQVRVPAMTDFLKAEQLKSNKWRVLSIPFGGEFQGDNDAQKERFTRRTDIKPDWFDRRPAIWHHGQDPAMKDETVGFTDDLELDERAGWWSTLWLNRGARYRDQIEEMLRGGKAYGSSGAISHLVRIDKPTGEILVWPHAEQTLTTMPINFLSRIVPAKAVAHFDEADIGLEPAVRGMLTDLDSLKADLRPDLATAADVATRGRLAGDLSALLERTRNL